MGAGAFIHGSGRDESLPPCHAKARSLGEAEVQIFSGGSAKCQALQGATASRNLVPLTLFADNFH